MYEKNKIVLIFRAFLIFCFCSCTKTTKEYYPNGELRAEYTLDNKKKEGVYNEYYPSGELKIEAHYQQGLLDGARKEFYQNGKSKKTTYYKRDIKDGFEYFYNSDGKLDSLEESVLINPNCLNGSTGKIDDMAKSFLDTLEIPKVAILNRCLYFDKNHNVIKKKSHFFDITFDKDTISMHDSIKVEIVFHHRYNDLPNVYSFTQVIDDSFSLFNFFETQKKKLIFYEKPRKKGVNCVRGYIEEGTPYRNDTVTSVLFVSKKYFVR